jgi:two-component system chemotaxis response regulator CheB
MLNPIPPKSNLQPAIRVLVVDDSVVVRKILTDVLRDEAGIEVVGTASNGAIALQRIPQLSPDVVTLDIEMPELDGIATLREIKRQYPKTRVIMCSTLTERGAAITIEALSSGADDYITKSLRHTEEGGIAAFQSQLVPKIRQFFRQGPEPVGGRLRSPLTPAAPGLRVAQVPLQRAPFSRPAALAIGVSTGGPNALAEVVPALPKNFPIPVFIVQHMPPMFTRLLAERLQSQSKVKVVEGQQGMEVFPGTVYIAPGDYHMRVVRSGGKARLQMNQDPMENSCRPAVDVLFRSVAEVYGGAVVSVILTGMGQDGLRGVEQLRGLGSYVIAQDEASSVVWGMPGFVVRAGLADSVCDLRSVVPEILRRV